MKHEAGFVVNDISASLLFLRRDGEILLALKKRGLGAGLINGVGGKQERGETMEHAMVRECQEEIGVTPTVYHKVAEHDFVMDSDTSLPWHMYVQTYLATEWRGEPTETEEMAPSWYPLVEIPYDSMWQDDRHWLPRVLDGLLLQTKFCFSSNEALLTAEVTEVSHF